MTEQIRAPKHLAAATRRWFEQVVSDWELEEHHRRVLQATCEAWDTMQAALAIIRRDGLVVETKAGGPRTHPAVKIAAEARLQFFRGVRELDLDVVEAPSEARRPPMLRSMRGGRGAA